MAAKKNILIAVACGAAAGAACAAAGKAAGMMRSRAVKEPEQEENDTAYLKGGFEVNRLLKGLASGISACACDEDFRIRRIIRSQEAAPGPVRTVMLQESGPAVTAWLSGADTVMYHTEARCIFMNPDSACMFSRMAVLEDFSGMAGWDPSGVIDAHGMFLECRALKSLSPMRGLDFGSARFMSRMFEGCSSLRSLSGLEGIRTGRAEDMSRMFKGCRGLRSLSALEGLDTAKVRKMSRMFADCGSLASLNGIGTWDTSEAEDMSEMFKWCDSLSDVGAISGWNVGKARDLSRMFDMCLSLKDASSLSRWPVPESALRHNMFEPRCRKPGWAGQDRAEPHMARISLPEEECRPDRPLTRREQDVFAMMAEKPVTAMRTPAEGGISDTAYTEPGRKIPLRPLQRAAAPREPIRLKKAGTGEKDTAEGSGLTSPAAEPGDSAGAGKGGTDRAPGAEGT